MNTLNIPCAPYKMIIINNDDDNNYKEKIENNIRLTTDSEGRVLYYLNNENETIGLIKVKTIWYICLRALREKCAYYFNLLDKGKRQHVRDINDIIDKRYNEIQKWLKLSNKEINYWKNIGKRFAIWLKNKRKEETINSGVIKSTFPSLWKKFQIDDNDDDNYDKNNTKNKEINLEI